MEILHLSTETLGLSVVTVKVLSTNKIYKFETSAFIAEKFRSKNYRSKGGFSSLNFLKKNSKLLN
jgi:hypothetical protein